MNRHQIDRWERQRVLAIALAMVFIISLIWVVVWAVTYNGKQAESCENQGGHMYSRQVGKITYTKCVNDDNEVIQT